MNHALSLARRGIGWVEPNPAVGAVIVRDGQILGEGWHHRFGDAHAEVEALKDARQREQDVTGATMYVTLEPCAHQGKTPPCADAVVDAKLGRVVVAMTDPFPQVAGRGISRLRDAGINVALGLCEGEARLLNRPFLKRVETGLPWVILKWAQTLDGKIATACGDSKWISSAASRRQVHQLRARVDAIMVGVGTATADDPALTARDVELRRTARRVIVDPHLRIPERARLLQDGGPPVLIATGKSADASRLEYGQTAVELLRLSERSGGGLDLQPLLHHLAQSYEASTVLVEGGAALGGSLFEQGLVDQVLAFVAPKVAGDQSAISATVGRSLESIKDAWPLQLRHCEAVDGDVLLDYDVVPR